MIITSWKIKGIFKADAQKVSEEIAEIGETVEPSEIVEKARDESTELHKCFEIERLAIPLALADG